VLDAAGCAATPTTWIALAGNLNASAPMLSWDAASPDATSNFSAEGRPAYTAEGAEVKFRAYFTHTWAQTWQWHVLRSCDAVELGSGQLLFDEAGALVNVEVTAPLCLEGGSCDSPIRVDFGAQKDGDHDDNDDHEGVTSTSEKSVLTKYEQDGHGPIHGNGCK
jgi:hypothetical protein